jgi:hypothetical protein
LYLTQLHKPTPYAPLSLFPTARLLAIPWLAFLFGVVVAVLLFRAASTAVSNTSARQHVTDSVSDTVASEEDRGSVSEEKGEDMQRA